MIGHLESIQHGLSLRGGISQWGCFLDRQGIMRFLPSHLDLWYSWCHFWLSTLQIRGHTSCLEIGKCKIICVVLDLKHTYIHCHSQNRFSVSPEESEDSLCPVTLLEAFKYTSNMTPQKMSKKFGARFSHIRTYTLPI